MAVAFGGALGAVGRWGSTVWLDRVIGGTFPFGTLFVNVAGSFLLGLAVVWVHASGASSDTRHFLTIGLLGSFTTFSTYSFEALAMLEAGSWIRAGSYVLGSVALGLLGVAAGMAVGARVT